MPINPDALGKRSDPREFSWTSKDSILYALGVGAGANDPTGFGSSSPRRIPRPSPNLFFPPSPYWLQPASHSPKSSEMSISASGCTVAKPSV
jgi:hypothetical protein